MTKQNYKLSPKNLYYDICFRYWFLDDLLIKLQTAIQQHRVVILIFRKPFLNGCFI